MRRKLDRIFPAMLARLDVPVPLAALLDRQAEIAAMKRETVAIPQPADLVLSGRTLDQARAEVAKAKTRADATDPAPLNDAADAVARQITSWITEHSDDLIEGPLRVAAADVLEQAATPAEILAEFYPAFEPGAIVASGNAAHLEAWQSSRDLNQQLEDLRRGWMRLYRMTVAKPRSDRPSQEFTPKRCGGVHAWIDPSLVADLRLRDGKLGDVLAIAPHRGNYRLASPGEILKLTTRHRLYRPMRGHRPGPALEFDPR